MIENRMNLFEQELALVHEISTLTDLSLKGYKTAIIYYHRSMEGVLAAIAVKTLFRKYNIEFISSHPFLKGGGEYYVDKEINNTLLAIVDPDGNNIHVKIKSNNVEYDFDEYIGDVFKLDDISNIKETTDDKLRHYGFNTRDVMRSAFGEADVIKMESNYMAMGFVINNIIRDFITNDKFLDGVVALSGANLLSLYNSVVHVGINNGYRPPDIDIIEILDNILINIDEVLKN